MTDAEQREAARQFIKRWRRGGDEKQQCHLYWIDLLQNVLGIENPTGYIRFEKSVKLPEGDGKVHTRYIDGYIPDVHVLIEQKGSKHQLDEKEPQSGGEMLTPYEQAKRYNDNLPISEKARWIVTCNFTDIWVYDMDTSVPVPEKINLLEMQDKYKKLDFLVKKDVKELSHEMEVSIKAGDLVGLIYDAFRKQYGIPDKAPKNESEEENKKREHKLRSLNALCVRLVFLLYAEDAGIFERDQFDSYMRQFSVKESRHALIELFKVLDTPENERDEYLEDDLAAFPYVNGGLFSDESIEIPQFNEEIRNLLLEDASEGFDWRDISPTIFGAVFESTLNPETRRAGGMHYTSIENIHKVIDPLFLDDLKAEFEEIKAIAVQKTKRQHLIAFQDKLASLTFLDPACGSGNFLTESYLSLRRLENQVIRELTGGQIALGTEQYNPIKVSIQQFYGIEINDFAVTVAKTALWIAESQMLEETKAILYGFNDDFLPLKTYVNITEGNALRLDWNNVAPKEKLNYIMGNPPFIGYSYQSKSQKKDILNLYLDESGKSYRGSGKIDYVSGWYFKAADLICGTSIRCAFVSTNSITQGEQVTYVWKPLIVRFGIHIDFAYRTFRWDSEASLKAHVHCVIIGYSSCHSTRNKSLYTTNYKTNEGGTIEEIEEKTVDRINPYLIPAQDFFIENRTNPLCNVPKMMSGNRPADGGNLILSAEEYEHLIKKEPSAEKFVKRFMMGNEFINSIPRYCLWLVGISPSELKKYPLVLNRVEKCRENRLSGAPDRQKLAETPTLMREQLNPDHFVAIPVVSSQRRRYIPIGYLDNSVIAGNKLFIIPDAKLYHFGILESNVHMAWMRVVCGRLKSDYSYSKGLVYNNFPWPSPTDSQKQKVEQTAQGVLDARALYPDSSLADLYDPLTMPPELRKAHQANDRAVMAAYGFSLKMSESDCVAELMKMYQRLTEEKK